MLLIDESLLNIEFGLFWLSAFWPKSQFEYGILNNGLIMELV